MTQGKLYLFPTPISDDPSIEEVLPMINLEILKGVTYFVVENTRTARRFISKCRLGLDISTLNFVELSEHTRKEDIDKMIIPILKGQDCILMSEAGVPAIADPGSDLVAIAHAKNIQIVPLVGPSSIVMALMSSGMNGQSFSFNGYLPIKPEERNKKISDIARIVMQHNQSQIFIETPYRNVRLFESLKTILPPTMKLCVAANLSSKDQFIKTMSISQWRSYSSELPINKVPAIFVVGQC